MRHLCAGDARADAVGDSPQSRIDGREGFGTRVNREVAEIDVDRQPRHVADEQIDGRPAFQCEAGFLRDGRENTDQQLDLSSIDLTEGQRDPPER